MTVRYGPLAEGDVESVWPWLLTHLRWHLRHWSDRVGLDWTDDDIERRFTEGRLIHQEWTQIYTNASADDGFVEVARGSDGRLLGLVFAEARHDRYLGQRIGVLSWLFVDSAHRGTGIGEALMAHAMDWMRERGLAGAEVFVTAGNEAAVRRYLEDGFTVVDHRMLVRL
jgi:GNAT superfamily N-acetyltransferase